jgi:fructose-1,6-bisphosphatase-3
MTDSNDAICMLDEEIRYLKLLSKQYPTIASACTEIINLYMGSMNPSIMC